MNRLINTNPIDILYTQLRYQQHHNLAYTFIDI